MKKCCARSIHLKLLCSKSTQGGLDGSIIPWKRSQVLNGGEPRGPFLLPLLCAVHQPRALPSTRTQPPEAGVGAQTYMAQLPKPPLPRCLTRSQWLQTTPHLPHAETVPAPQRTPVPHRSRPHTQRRAANPSCRIGPSDGRARGKQPSSHLSARDPRVPPRRRGNGRS